MGVMVRKCFCFLTGETLDPKPHHTPSSLHQNAQSPTALILSYLNPLPLFFLRVHLLLHMHVLNLDSLHFKFESPICLCLQNSSAMPKSFEECLSLCGNSTNLVVINVRIGYRISDNVLIQPCHSIYAAEILKS